MRRIVRSEAICLRVQDYHESSKLVTFFTLDGGKVSCLAKGARRLKSKFGAALDIFAQSRIIYYSHETRTLLTLSDAEIIHVFNYSRLPTPDSLSRFLAAEQMAEFALRVIQPHDPSPQLYRLLINYLSTIESCPPPSSLLTPPSSLLPPPSSLLPPPSSLLTPPSSLLTPPSSVLSSPYPALVCSFLLKAASFLGFRPELRRCLICRRPIESSRPAFFDPSRGGVICPRCAGEHRDMTGEGHDRNPLGISDRVPSLARLDPASLDALTFLLYTPASEIASLVQPPSSSLLPPPSSLLDLVLGFLGHHFDPLVLNSFHWHASLERNV